jgi:hypothetical protein
MEGYYPGEGDGAWLTQNYRLPVVYMADPNVPEGYRSHRMIDSTVCAKVRENRAAAAALVSAGGFSDDDGARYPKREDRFCALSMPERPNLPLVRVLRREAKIIEGGLPVTRITTTITMPDGRSIQVLGGHAAPLSLVPVPIMGCALNSGAPSWVCAANFSREGFTPIISGSSKFHRDAEALATALGLKPVAIAERRGVDPEPVVAKIATVEDTTLSRQLANIDAMISDPLAKVTEWRVGVVESSPDALGSRADAIMVGIERAASFAGSERYKAKESGRILAGLLARLPRDRFVGFGPRILAAYAKADDGHWLWDADPLLRRMGELGTDALPYLTNEITLRSPNGAAIEGLCRVGAVGRAVAEPALLAAWSKSRDGFDRDKREAMFVAMRRSGVTPPPLADDKHAQFARLQSDWADISENSPSRVCAVSAEQLARRQEQREGKRRTNVD